MEKEDQIYVRYGDYISLHVEHLQGMFASQGFSNRNCILQYNPLLHQDCFTRNKRDFCFQIWPRLAFDARQDYQNALEFFNRQFINAEIDEENEQRAAAAEPEEKEEPKKEGEGQAEAQGEEAKQEDGADAGEPGSKEDASTSQIQPADGSNNGGNVEDGSQMEPVSEEVQQEDLLEDEDENKEEDKYEGYFQKNTKQTNLKVLSASMKKDRDNYIQKLKQLKRKVKDEEQQNIKTFNFKRGHFVEYGNIIQLMHVDSEKFIQTMKTCADEDTSCNKVDLATQGGNQVYFQILGGFKYKQEGDRIHYNDQVLFLNVKGNSYLHVTERLLTIECLEGNYPPHLQEGVKKITPQEIDRRSPPSQFVPYFEVNMSNIKTKFQIQVFRYFDEDIQQQFIKGGMVVRLLHSEKEGFLHSDNQDFTGDGTSEVYLWNFKGKKTDNEALSSNSLFEIETAAPITVKNESHQENKNTDDLLEVKRQDPEKRFGQVFQYSQLRNPEQIGEVKKSEKDQEFRFRHLNTGRLIIDQEIDYNGFKIRTLGLAPHIMIKDLGKFSERHVETVLPELEALDQDDNNFEVLDQLSGNYLTYKEIDKRSRFRIISTSPSVDTRIKRNSCVQIQHIASEMYLSYTQRISFAEAPRKEDQDDLLQDANLLSLPELNLDSPKPGQNKRNSNAGEGQGSLFQKVDIDDIQSGSRDAVELTPARSNEDAFFIIPEQKSVLNSILFIQTAIDLLKKYLPTICSRNLELSKEKQTKISDVLEKINEFLVGDNEDVHLKTSETTLVIGFSKEKNDELQMKESNLKLRQKLMRELYIVESLVQMIYLPFSYGEHKLKTVVQNDVITTVCQNAYQMIKTIGQGYYQNELYVSQWINLYFNHAMNTNHINNIGAEETIISLVDNNKRLLEMQINPVIIEQIINLCVQQNRNAQLIQLLKAICSCNGEPIPNNQKDIVKILLGIASNKAFLMTPIRLSTNPEDQDLSTVDMCINKEGNGQLGWIPIKDFRKIKKSTYYYFLNILELSSELCLGRNGEALDSIQEMFSYDSIKIVIKDRNLPYEMRALFMRMLHIMHMDREPLEPIQIPSQTGVWDDLMNFEKENFLDPNNITYAIKQSKIQVPKALNSIKKFVENYLLETQGVQKMFETGKNMMTLEILKIIKFMLNHGFYINLKELKQIAVSMINLLNGANDVYFENDEEAKNEFVSSKRYFSSGSNDIIVQSKTVICENLLTISKIEIDGKTQVFLSKFKGDLERINLQKKMSKANPDAFKKTTTNQEPVQEAKASFFQSIKMSLGKVQVENPEIMSFKQVENENIEFLQEIACSYNFEANNQDVYICVLFDLLLYKYPSLAKGVFELLVKLFTRKQTLLENLQKIQMLENPRSIRVLSQVQKFYHEIKVSIEDADLWLNSSNSLSKKQKKKISQIFLFFAHLCTESSILNDDDDEDDEEDKDKDQANMGLDFSRQDSINSQSDITMKKTNTTALGGGRKIINVSQKDFILYHHNEEKAKANYENQRLLGTFQVEAFALFFIKYRTDKSQINDPYYQQLITSCFKFLVNYVRNNFQNQIMVHNNLDIFLREIEKNPLICLLIYELFKNNKQFLTLNVTKILRTIILSAEESSLQSSKKALYLKLLEVFCKFEDKLVRPNQQEIVVSFTRDISKNNLIYLFSQEGINHLIKLIQACIPNQYKDKALKKNELDELVDELDEKQQKSIEMSMEIFNVIQCINLMSLCCEGKNDLSEVKCQTEIINLNTALILYKNSGRFWQFKQTIVNYVSNCYIESSNYKLFNEKYSASNIRFLKDFVHMLAEDIGLIFEEWHLTENDFKIIMPDLTVTSFQKESKILAMQSVCLFFQCLVRNKSIDLGVEMFPTYHEIITKIAKLYYETKNQKFKNNAMDVLTAVNNSEKYSCLLENVQHPANQNIYIEAQKIGKKVDNSNVKGQKSNSLGAKLIQLAYSPEMIEKKEREFEDLVLWVTNIDLRINFIMENNALISGNRANFNPESFENVSYSPIICSFMDLLDSKCLNKDLHIAGLTLLRKIVEVENREMVTPSSDWDGNDWLKYKKIIEAKQNSLVDIGCVEFLCKHIQEIDDDEILEQTFLVCITLLLGGNKKSQEAFFNFFMNQDPNNTIMQKLKALLVEQFSQTKKVIGERNAKLAMIHKTNLRKQAEKEDIKIQDLDIQSEKVKPEKAALNKGGLMGISSKIMDGIGGKKAGLDPLPNDEGKKGDDEEEVAAEEYSNDDENLLTLDESIPADGEGQNKTESDSIDEMFLVNQIKQQYIIRTMRLLRFLQLLTEGHHSDLQNFLREQKHANGVVNQKSFDFISYVAQMLAIFEKQYINCYTCSLGMQLIETLIEMVQGPCQLNQKRLVEAKIIDCCRDLIQQGQQTKNELEQRGFTTEAKLEFHDQLKMTAIKLLLSIIEGSVNIDIYRQIADSLDDFVILTYRMESIYEKFVKDDLNISENSTLSQVNAALRKDSFTGNITEGFNIYCLINQLAMALPDVKEKIDSFSATNIFQFFKRNTGNVEVHKDDEVMTIYFPIHPVSHFLTQGTMNNFNQYVCRESNTHKILDLISKCPSFIDEMEHLELRSHDFIKITPERLGFLRDFSTLIAVAISFICISYYKYAEVEQPDGSFDMMPLIDDRPQLIMNYLGYFQLATAFSLITGFCINKINIILKSGWRRKTTLNKILLFDDIKSILQPLTPTFNELRVQDLPLKAARILMLTEGPEHGAFYDHNGERNFYYTALYFEYKWICLSFLMQDSDFIFSLAYLAFSLQGLIQSPIFYSCHLADVINRFPQLQNVIQSVTINGKSLLMTAMLGLIIIYIFSAFGFIFVYDNYYDEGINTGLLNRMGDSVCQTMLHCFLSTINYGIRGGGGIGDILPDQTAAPHNVQGFYFRQVFDLGFFIIVITVLLNIIFGIIIDTFALLREHKQNTDDDINNVCFICHIDRQTFDRETEEGFDVHIQYDHNVWQYVNFIIHLMSIDVTELNGTESYILELFKKEDIQWFPMQKSQRLIMVQQQRLAQKQALLAGNEGDGEEGQEGGQRTGGDVVTEIPLGLNDIEEKIREVEKKYQ